MAKINLVDFIHEIKLQELKQYYINNNKELTIVGLNDSQGVKTTTLFRKGLLDFIADSLEDEDIKTTVINAFSLMFNKTEHINYLLKSNPSLDEIKDLQVYGMVKALEKVMEDVHMPKCLGKVGYVSKALYHHKDGDENVKLTTTLEKAKEPIVIYSCGANDLMREGWNNPFKIGKDYKKQNDAYRYALEKLSDVSSVKRVIGRVEGNINDILSINDKTDIFALGLYIPKSMQNEAMKVFNDAIKQYNEYLEKICDKYNLEYVDTEKNSKNQNKSKINFHVTTVGHHEIVNNIIDKLYDQKIGNKNSESIKFSKQKDFNVGRYGLYEMLVDLKFDLNKIKSQTQNLSKVEQEISKEKQLELERQIAVVEKVLIKKI